MGVQVRPELVQRHLRSYRLAVADDVEIRIVEVDDTPVGPSMWASADVPLVGDGPVENLRATRHFVHLDRDALPDPSQSRPDAVAGDAAAKREQLGRECVHSFPRIVDRDHVQIGLRHDRAQFGLKSGYERSRSLMTVISPGHSIPNAASS